jgi:glutaredoxin
MITLYVRSGCPYCAKVLAVCEQLHLEPSLKNVAEEGVADELIARGGKQQMPYMVDDETGTEMYESDDIITYLHQRFGADKIE